MNDRKSPSKHPQDRLWTPLFLLVIFVTLCVSVCGQALGSGATVFLNRIGGSATLAGIGAAAFSLAAAVARLAVGKVLDTRGRKLALVVGLVVMSIGTYMPIIVCTDITFILWRIMQGLGFAWGLTAASTMAADVLPYRYMGVGMSYFGLGQALSIAIGPLCALILVNTDPATNLFLGITGAGVLGLILSCFIRYEKYPTILSPTAEYRVRWERAQGVDVPDPGLEEFESLEESSEKNDSKATASFPPDNEEAFQERIARNPLLRLLNKFFDLHAYRGSVPMAFLSGMFSFAIFYLALFGEKLGVANAGLFFTIAAIIMIVIRLGSNWYTQKFSPLSIIWCSAICGTCCYTILLGCQLGWFGEAFNLMFLIAAIPYGISCGVAMPVSLTMAVQCSDPARWGAANALYYFCYDLAVAAGGFAWGVLNDVAGFAITMVCVIAVGLFSMVVAWKCYPESAR